MILHNNGESIEPKGVYSDQIIINFFAFNRKLNIFSVYFENPKDLKTFTIEYDYLAIGLIKTILEPLPTQNKNYFHRMKNNDIKNNSSKNGILSHLLQMKRNII